MKKLNKAWLISYFLLATIVATILLVMLFTFNAMSANVIVILTFVNLILIALIALICTNLWKLEILNWKWALAFFIFSFLHFWIIYLLISYWKGNH